VVAMGTRKSTHKFKRLRSGPDLGHVRAAAGGGALATSRAVRFQKLKGTPAGKGRTGARNRGSREFFGIHRVVVGV